MMSCSRTLEPTITAVVWNRSHTVSSVRTRSKFVSQRKLGVS
jgi:hypothetical protein